MKYILTKEHVSIPDDVTVSAKSREVEVIGFIKYLYYKDLEGKQKKVSNTVRSIYLLKPIRIRRLRSIFNNGRCQVRSIASQINNMIIGVTKGFRYKMVCAFAHYPIGFRLYNEGSVIEIYNFLGERRKRIIKALPGVKAIKNEYLRELRDIITIVGNDINNVSQTCALIHQSFKVGNRKDIRKFLDGVYVSEKRLEV